MSVPSKIRINGYDYRVREKKGLPGADIGRCTNHLRDIQLEKKMPEATKFSVLWHEAIHAVLLNAGNKDHAEELIEQLEAGVVQLLRDNPYLRGEHLFEPQRIVVDMSAKELAEMSAEDLTAHVVNNGDEKDCPPELRDAMVERLLDNSPDKIL